MMISFRFLEDIMSNLFQTDPRISIDIIPRYIFYEREN